MSILRARGLVPLVTAEAVSALGSQMTFLALPWFVLVTTGSAAETEAAGAELAGQLRAGDVVAVAGELGAGKTTFVRGACRALGVSSPVTSPTFTIGHRYEAPVPVAHLDLYRLAGLSAEEGGDLAPYFDGPIALVEGPEHAGAWLPPLRATVTLVPLDELHRSIRVDSDDDPRL